MPCRPVGQRRSVAGLLNDDVDDTVGNYDDLDHLLALQILLGSLSLNDCLLDLVSCGIGSKVHRKSGLTVEGDAECLAVLLEILFVPDRPRGVADRCLVTELLPEFLADVGGKGGEQGDELLVDALVVAVLLGQFVDTYHEGADRSVVAEDLYVGAYFLNELVDRLQALGLGSALLGVDESLLVVCQVPQFLKETEAAVNTIAVPRFTLVNRAEKHLVETQRIGSVSVYDVVWIDNIEHAL